MATHTTVAAFRAALFAALVADASLGGAGVQVEYGEPAADRRDELVWLGNSVTSGINEPNAMVSGRRKRDEDYFVELVVQCASRSTCSANEIRGAAMVGAVEDILALDTTLSVDGIIWASIETFEWETDLSGDAGTPRTTVTISIQVRGRLA